MARVVILIAVLGIALPLPAEGAIVIRRDLTGRAITFDVPAGTNVNAYAAALRSSLHGDEIGSVTIRFVGRATLARSCGSANVSCYRSRRRDEAEILLPLGGGSSTRNVLLHEYAHHLDASYGLTSSWRRSPAAMRWWRARRVEQRLRSGEVAWDYELGWQRSIGEIFAEDYVQLHGRPRYGIRWLRPPNSSVLAALRRDIREALDG